MILTCNNNCKHEFQDKKYGKGNRVHNPTRKNSGSVYRCTVCGAERQR